MSIPTILEPHYVVDTNALIWFLTQDKKLSKSALSIFQAASRNETLLILPAIVMAELYYSDKKFGLFANFRATYQHLASQTYVAMVDFNAASVLDFDTLAAIPEMHDRIIVGVAYYLKAPLITSDPVIIASGLVTIVW